MIAPTLKVIIAGILGGIVLFAIPFLLFKAFFIFLLIGLIFRIISGRRPGRWRNYNRFLYDDYLPYESKENMIDIHNQNPKNV